MSACNPLQRGKVLSAGNRSIKCAWGIGISMGLSMMSWMAIAVGAAFGGMARLAVSELCASLFGAAFPWGTLVVNVIGSFAIGVLAVWLHWPLVDTPLAALLIAGVLGGFTTVSSFSLQTLSLREERHSRWALLNVVLTLVLGIAAAALGWWFVGSLAGNMVKGSP